MAVKRGKSQARRNSGNNSSGLPGWAWLVLGVVLTLGVILAAPRFLKSDGQDGFFRPRPNPDARPAAAKGADDDGVVPEPASTDAEKATAAARGEQASEETQFDFYTLLPGKEVAMSDAELAASAREEAARAQREQAQQAAAAQRAAGTTATDPSQAGTTAPSVPATSTAATTTATTPVAVAGTDTRYILQAGAFGASGDAEALKARIALLGLGARVESASINGKTLYRVRMGPYGTASELAEAKGKLGNGGLPAMAIKVK
jgi:cell division protein FtsN